MPIAQITLSETLADTLRKDASHIMQDVTDILTTGLGADPTLVQVTICAALVPPQGHEVLCMVFHRASEMRHAQMRATVAQDLRDALHRLTGQSVRVRLIALEPAAIAASDTSETLV